MDHATATTALRAALEQAEYRTLEQQAVCDRGLRALRALPDGMDPLLVRSAVGRFLDLCAYRVWPCLVTLHPDHVAAVVSEVASRPAKASHRMPAEFLLEAADQGAFERGARAVSMLVGFGRAPGSKGDCRAARLVSGDPVLVSAARRALRVHDEPFERAAMFWLWVVLAQDGSPPSIEALEIIGRKNPLVERILDWYAADPAVERLRATLFPASSRPEPRPSVAPRANRRPSTAYVLAEGTAERHDGWSRGRPPGIGPAAWPRSRSNGVPLGHVITLALPEEYRVRDPRHVAVSLFFGDQERDAIAGVAEVIRGTPLDDGDTHEPFWQALAEYARSRHPTERYDDWVSEFAWIWLTEEEFRGAPCPLPTCRSIPTAPEELSSEYADFVATDLPPEWIALEPYDDPNVGLAPVDEEPDGPDAYVRPFGEKGEAMGLGDRLWAIAQSNHLGGTCFPAGGFVPDGLSPFYLDLYHDLGGMNLGGNGSGQLDLLHDTWKWGC